MVNVTVNALVHITNEEITMYLPQDLNRHAKKVIERKKFYGSIQRVRVEYSEAVTAKYQQQLFGQGV